MHETEKHWFKAEKRWYGRHAEMVRELTKRFFKHNMDVYKAAPLVGLMFQVVEDEDKTQSRKDQVSTAILADQMMQIYQDMWFRYRLVMLLDKEYEQDLEQRIDKAFRYQSDEDMERFESYVRGGISKLYEQLVENSSHSTMHCADVSRLIDFVSEWDDHYYKDLTREQIVALCQ